MRVFYFSCLFFWIRHILFLVFGFCSNDQTRARAIEGRRALHARESDDTARVEFDERVLCASRRNFEEGDERGGRNRCIFLDYHDSIFGFFQKKLKRVRATTTGVVRVLLPGRVTNTSRGDGCQGLVSCARSAFREATREEEVQSVFGFC